VGLLCGKTGKFLFRVGGEFTCHLQIYHYLELVREIKGPGLGISLALRQLVNFLSAEMRKFTYHFQKDVRSIT
jgi:hypothetical protein